MAEERKRLFRSRSERWLAGVCGGIGDYFNIDVTVIRILFILFALVFGSGLLFYIILWIIIPLEPDVVESVPVQEEE
jgi:phage shock protein C